MLLLSLLDLSSDLGRGEGVFCLHTPQRISKPFKMCCDTNTGVLGHLKKRSILYVSFLTLQYVTRITVINIIFYRINNRFKSTSVLRPTLHLSGV